jgi:dTDP-4-amino-4,6-dideoxygalactose transaminase
MAEEQLALEGGTPVRTEPLPQRRPFGDKEIELAAQAIRSQNLFRWGGTFVAQLEARFAKFYGAPGAAACTSGTASLHLAVGAINPDPGDEIITAPITDLGSIIPILYQGAIPIFADVDPETGNMDPDDTEAKITDRTRAIMVIHLFGSPAPMDRFVEIARKHDLPLIEDASQCHATRYKGRYAGTYGDIGCFSFQQSKHMTCGDGGATISVDEETVARMRLFSDKGWVRGGEGPRGYIIHAPNYRMTELHAAVLLAQLEKVRHVVERRMALGDYLNTLLVDVEQVKTPPRSADVEHSYWLYPLRLVEHNPERFAEALRAEGIPAGAGYVGKPIYLCAASLRDKKTYGSSHWPFGSDVACEIEYKEGMCPRTEQFLKHVVTLPLHEHMAERDMEDYATALRKVARGLKP